MLAGATGLDAVWRIIYLYLYKRNGKHTARHIAKRITFYSLFEKVLSLVWTYANVWPPVSQASKKRQREQSLLNRFARWKEFGGSTIKLKLKRMLGILPSCHRNTDISVHLSQIYVRIFGCVQCGTTKSNVWTSYNVKKDSSRNIKFLLLNDHFNYLWVLVGKYPFRGLLSVCLDLLSERVRK